MTKKLIIFIFFIFNIAFISCKFLSKAPPSSHKNLNNDSNKDVFLNLGFPNLGNTCYLNSALKLLWVHKEFKEAIEKIAQDYHKDTHFTDLNFYEILPLSPSKNPLNLTQKEIDQSQALINSKRKEVILSLKNLFDQLDYNHSLNLLKNQNPSSIPCCKKLTELLDLFINAIGDFLTQWNQLEDKTESDDNKKWNEHAHNGIEKIYSTKGEPKFSKLKVDQVDTDIFFSIFFTKLLIPVSLFEEGILKTYLDNSKNVVKKTFTSYSPPSGQSPCRLYNNVQAGIPIQNLINKDANSPLGPLAKETIILPNKTLLEAECVGEEILSVTDEKSAPPYFLIRYQNFRDTNTEPGSIHFQERVLLKFYCQKDMNQLEPNVYEVKKELLQVGLNYKLVALICHLATPFLLTEFTSSGHYTAYTYIPNTHSEDWFYHNDSIVSLEKNFFGNTGQRTIQIAGGIALYEREG